MINKKLQENSQIEDEFLFDLSQDEKFIILVTKSKISKLECSNILDSNVNVIL